MNNNKLKNWPTFIEQPKFNASNSCDVLNILQRNRNCFILQTCN